MIEEIVYKKNLFTLEDRLSEIHFHDLVMELLYCLLVTLFLDLDYLRRILVVVHD